MKAKARCNPGRWVAVAILATGRCGAAESPRLVEVRQALEERIPQVAATKAEELIGKQGITVEEREAASFLLARALYELGQPEEALTRLRPLLAAGYPGAALLYGQLLAAEGKWREAQGVFHAQAAMPNVGVDGMIGEAECLQAQDRIEDAIGVLQAAARRVAAPAMLQLQVAGLLAESRQVSKAQALLSTIVITSPSEERWKSYLEGRLLLLRDRPDAARIIFESLLGGRESLPESLLVATTFGLADAIVALKGSDEGDRPLEEFIHQHPTSPYLGRVFRRLDEVYAMEDDPPDEPFRGWIQLPQARRAALARYYLAKMQARQGKTEKAAANVEHFIRAYPNHPLMTEACLLQSEVLSRKRNFGEAARALDGAMRRADDADTRAEIELRSGLIHYQQGEFLLAVSQFEAAAKRSASVRPVATFNAALTWLAQRNFDRFRGDFDAFVQLQPTSPLRAELVLEAGLTQARAGSPAAKGMLDGFLHEYPEDPRRGEARLALAELALLHPESGMQPEKALEEAGRYLRTVSATAPPAEVEGHAEYLAIWLADSQEPRNDEKTISLARNFLAAHSQSEWVPGVRMKLGQIYFNREDYANAETYFAQLARNAPNSPLAESALFLAGQSAAKLMNAGAIDRALAFFDTVVQLEGSLKLYARQEQAHIQNRLSHEDQAVALYDMILNATPPPDPELRQATLCGKADSLLALGGREGTKEGITAAVAVYNELAALPEVSPMWRNQALFKKGKALERLGDKDGAIVAYYDVLNRSASGGREYFWLYKAGFDAARLLEQQEQWSSAAGLYEKMAAFEGPRSAEARTRLKQVRLEHYLLE